METMETTATKQQTRRPVLDVLRELLADGRDDEIVELVTKLLTRNTQLEAQLAARLLRRQASEGVSSNQLLLMLGELADQAANDGGGDERPTVDAKLDTNVDAAELARRKLEEEERKKRRKRQPPVRKPFPDHLRRVDNPIEVPAEQRPCPHCGGERTCIGHDVTEVVELIPAELIVRRDRREKLACRTCEARESQEASEPKKGKIVRAPVSDKVVEGGRCGPMLVATMLVDKYLDGLPWHRQAARFEKMGFKISVSTMADQAKWATDRLWPLWRIALEQCVQSTVMHLDATSMPVLDKQGDKGLQIGSMWGYVGDSPGEDAETVACIVYTSTGKKTKQQDHELGPEDVLALREGYTVADASNIFDASFARPGLIECGCNMHGRRYFKKALDAGDARAARPLAAYKRMYIIEDEIRELPVDEKRAARQARSRPVYDALIEWCHPRNPSRSPRNS